MTLPSQNQLGNQTSPYLLQHKDNPVHWRSWSQEALQEARAENKPILLSVGYAACHWCHVMAHECFEDQQVADVMNRLFVNIKVDREERPDIDQIYMTALTATGEQGGWPLTMFLTPEAKPFWGGTYFPKAPRFGRPGFIQVLRAVHKAWSEKQSDLNRSADALTTHVQQRLSPAIAEAETSAPPLHGLAQQIATLFDPEYGGLRGAPKFPNTPFLDILWLDWLKSRTTEHRDAVLNTLRFMLAGGIYDHVGGGLARYSTDAMWLVPHFEKMLYDNAQLIRLTGMAYAETGDPLFRRRIEDTVGWMLREMRVENGGFTSSFDADSEGEEGRYYVWTRDQIHAVLGDDTEELLSIYRLSSPEDWEGDPILHRLDKPHSQPEKVEDRLQTLLEKLRVVRDCRVPPARDDKVLVDWNGLAIEALAQAARLLNRPDWLDAAHRAYRFVCESMEEERLPHSIRGDKRLFPALASDYAAMISAAVALHGAYQDDQFIEQAIRWSEMLARWHKDETGDGFYLTAADSTDVPMRIRGDVDEAIPSATAQIITALTRLATLTGNSELYDQSVRTAETALARAQQQFSGQMGIVYAASLAQEPMKLLINEGPDENIFVPVANRNPDPRRMDLVLPETVSPAEKQLDIKIDRSLRGAWLCIGQRCLPRVSDPESLETALRSPD
ncbi:thioredoxin domain-containing protein [Chelativorans sp. YIM 93263]|uniref:thioredoxin domain-containing protein n=1 Tax=Chelativorans sp. YIM 93263 TaxID=2906648 RepID=UPI002379462F|nr:thioredoxin domain-containing protein [Chelativorans sp. YIM 93263]